MLKVKKKCCGKCLFGANKIVSAKRKHEILKECFADDAHFICHEGTAIGEDICCKAFFDKHTSGLIRVSQRLSMVEYVE